MDNQTHLKFIPWQKKLPMFFTMLRIYLTPIILLVMWPRTFEWNIVGCILFIAASITDYYDGYFARKYNAVSNMGKFMDPIADKILVSSILIALLARGVIDPYMIILIIARDTYIGGIRSVAAADNIIIDAQSAGKWKTAFQMVAIPTLILDYPHFPLSQIAYFFMWVTVALSLYSGWNYYRAYSKAKNY